MSIFSAITGALKSVINGVRLGVGVGDLIIDLVMYIPNIIKSIQKTVEIVDGGIDKDETKLLIDSGLEEFDNATGKEGIKILKGNIGGVEQTLDLFKMFMRNLLYLKFEIALPKEDITVKYDE